MWASRLLSHRSVRASALTAATAATSAPSAPATAFSDNSRAAIAAVSELADCLDFMFEKINYEEPGDLLQLHLERLGEEVAKYDNSLLADGQGKEWSCDSATAVLLRAACQCSCLVYGPLAQSDPDLVPIISRAPSATGTTKAISIWKLPSRKALVVSIRGTASATDHMVNMNSGTASAEDVLGLPMKLDAHKGFLHCAQALLPYLKQQIARQLQTDFELEHIMFTGHSAGGSVASLLFLHFAHNAQFGSSRRKLSLTTFGAAPTLSHNVTEETKALPSVAWVLSFVNEFDMVPKADQLYIRSIVDLYRSRYGLPRRLEATGSAAQDASTTYSQTGHNPSLPPYRWVLPPPCYQLLGDIIVSRKARRLRTASAGASDMTSAPTQQVTFYEVVPEDFHGLVFCDIGVHKRRVYLERLQCLDMSGGSNETVLSDASTMCTLGTCSRATTLAEEADDEPKQA